jgi:hypothetical protein
MKPEPRNIALDLILTILLCGLWNLIVQQKQIETLNSLLKTERYSFWKIYIMSLLTCGIYFIYFEYKKAEEISALTGKDSDSDPILAVVLSIFGLSIVFDAIAQGKLNAILDERAKLEATGSSQQ